MEHQEDLGGRFLVAVEDVSGVWNTIKPVRGPSSCVKRQPGRTGLLLLPSSQETAPCCLLTTLPSLWWVVSQALEAHGVLQNMSLTNKFGNVINVPNLPVQ